MLIQTLQVIGFSFNSQMKHLWKKSSFVDKLEDITGKKTKYIQNYL